ncbi:hypothetical protein EV368DRAFT_90105 [Lentinula lateritia]|uniref:Uncharacterized protein n=1 Tax=Lentinula aff. lateritia TaxID=2804960 RepID=A0ACC1TGB3_9AGAR|nr:hypothetical protein F5876DRAFT_84513 [Lentinula aff. lateritia]KAJ3845781.1 hypothetical protein EV368DRAFT_90105 [Lentinula lateritia]
MPATCTYTITVLNDNCAAANGGNNGHGVEFAANIFGPSFNAAGGGWCVTVFSRPILLCYGINSCSHHHVGLELLWQCGSTMVPASISEGTKAITDNCVYRNIGSAVHVFFVRVLPWLISPTPIVTLHPNLRAHNFLINLTFCGDWAGITSFWDLACTASMGVSDCNDYINVNLTAFSNTYLKINSIRIYE